MSILFNVELFVKRVATVLLSVTFLSNKELINVKYSVLSLKVIIDFPNEQLLNLFPINEPFEVLLFSL